jgi:hypothetical protein
MTAAPGWLTVGAKVAVLSQRASQQHPDVGVQVVERISAKTVTVGGERYPLDTLERQSGGWLGITWRLAPLTSPVVLEQRRDQQRRASALAAEKALAAWRSDPTDANSAALRVALARLDQFLN